MTTRTGDTLSTAIKENFQTAYVTGDSDAARAAVSDALNIHDFDLLDVHLNVIDDDDKKIGEIELKVTFALDRTVEIVEPVVDPFDTFTVDPSGTVLQFHHLGSAVADLDESVGEARERGLPVLRVSVPGLAEVAFIDLRQMGGHYLELLPLAALG